MLEIIVSLCLIAEPNVCKEEALPYVVPTDSVARCSVVSAPHVAQWAGEHPAWRIVRWRCGPAGERHT